MITKICTDIHTPCLKKLCKMFLSELRRISTIFDISYRTMAKRLKFCEMHSFSTSPNSHHHTTVLNADARNCYKTLRVVICSKLSNDLNSTCKVKCGLFSRIISSYRFKIVRIYARSGPHVHECKRLDANATENVKRHLQLHVFCVVVAFAASWEYVTVKG